MVLMGTSADYAEFVADCLHTTGDIRYRKMFGEYQFYVNDKPVVLVCDDTCFVKMLPDLEEVMAKAGTGFPYEGAREHYVLDIENRALVEEVIAILEPITKIPKPKTKKKKA